METLNCVTSQKSVDQVFIVISFRENEDNNCKVFKKYSPRKREIEQCKCKYFGEDEHNK